MSVDRRKQDAWRVATIVTRREVKIALSFVSHFSISILCSFLSCFSWIFRLKRTASQTNRWHFHENQSRASSDAPKRRFEFNFSWRARVLCKVSCIFTAHSLSRLGTWYLRRGLSFYRGDYAPYFSPKVPHNWSQTLFALTLTMNLWARVWQGSKDELRW